MLKMFKYTYVLVIFILYPIQLIGRPKLQRFASLAKHAEMSICVDDQDNIKEISAIAGENGVRIGLVVEVNVGQDR